MQSSPIARHLVQVVALLPTLQTVDLGGPPLVPSAATERGARPADRARDVGKGNRQPARQVVFELRPRQRLAGGEERIGGDGGAPGGDQRRNATPEMGPQRAALRACVFTCQHRSRRGVAAPSDDSRRRERPSGQRTHLLFAIPLTGFRRGDEGADVLGVDDAGVRETPAFCSSGWPPPSTAMAFR